MKSESVIDAFQSEIRNLKSEINVPLSRYTTSRIGGPADILIEANSADELKQIVFAARKVSLPIFMLGGGANVLVSDAGVRGLTIVNKAKRIEFQSGDRVWCEAGAILPTLARECGMRGLGGLEWALGVPGTIGGAVVGNAGAHGKDIAASLISATILNERDEVVEWSQTDFQYEYRSSLIKKSQRSESRSQNKSAARNTQYVVLTATFQLFPDDRAALEQRANEYTDYRRRTQPTGASIGSMFKNPEGMAAGRLIDQAGLKGTAIGGAEISEIHANFFINRGNAKASDVKALIDLAREKVKEQFGIELELEVELVGEW